jgi:hypothetical protein
MSIIGGYRHVKEVRIGSDRGMPIFRTAQAKRLHHLYCGRYANDRPASLPVVLPASAESTHNTLASRVYRCSGSRTSAALLKNIAPTQLTLIENIAGGLLTFGKNVLRLW